MYWTVMVFNFPETVAHIIVYSACIIPYMHVHARKKKYIYLIYQLAIVILLIN